MAAWSSAAEALAKARALGPETEQVRVRQAVRPPVLPGPASAPELAPERVSAQAPEEPRAFAPR